MSIETNLNISPYFDDFDDDKNYYKILFRPGVSVQARELTQIQDILQNQIKKFGDHVFKNGTIVHGVNFKFFPRYPYVKILDQQVDGQPVVPSGYLNLVAKNEANLQAEILNVKAGFQSTDPDISYLYLKYLNSGSNGSVATFANSDVLTIYSQNHEIFDYIVNNGGTSFSNSDTVEIVPAIIVTNSTIGAEINISQSYGNNTANAYVTEANTSFSITLDGTTYSGSTGYVLLKLRPITADLTSSSTSSLKWTFITGTSVVQGANSAQVVAIVGEGASATLTTDSSGIVTDVSVVNGGNGYLVDPFVSIKSTTGQNYNNLSIVPQAYKAQVTVANSEFTGGGANPVGNAYAFGVTEGVIYDKGFFVNVEPQTIVVNNYSTQANAVSVGFITNELIVNNNTDSSLLDNATGSPNFAAPGANRLKLIPSLAVVNTDLLATNNTFFPLAEFRNGEPYRQNKNTVYNILYKDLEQRTFETSGNFVVDPFFVNSKDKPTYSNTHIDTIVDTGVAYINGKRIDTERNTILSTRRSTDFVTANNQNLSFNYGKFLLVRELAGFFDFDSSPRVYFYSEAARTLSKGLKTGEIQTQGTRVGYADLRMITYDSGAVGTVNATYRLYLTDIVLEAGYNLSDARSVYYSGLNYNGIADLVLETDSNGNSLVVLNDANNGSLLFKVGADAVRSVSNVTYSYRSSVDSANISSNGVCSLTITDPFAFGNNITLSLVQRNGLTLVPLANAVSTNGVSGVTISKDSNVLRGTGFDTYFRQGDYVVINNPSGTGESITTSVRSVVNSNIMTVENDWTFNNGTGLTVKRAIVKNIPIPLGDDRVVVNTNSTGLTLRINLNGLNANTLALASSVNASLSYTASKVESVKLNKLVSRSNLVKIAIANNEGGDTGPWCLGIPDVFRLNKVYVGNSSVNTTSEDITSNFIITNGQTEDSYDLSYLVKTNSQGRQFAGEEYLLVEFDSFYLASPSSSGYFSVNSYPVSANNATRLQLGNTAINFIEIPEFKFSNGQVAYLENYLDFRPRVQNTAIVTANSNQATINPSSNTSFYTSDKIFPDPSSSYRFNYSYYVPRKDRVVIDYEGNISLLEGTPSETPEPTEEPRDAITIGIIDVPPYPTFPEILDSNILSLMNKRIGSSSSISQRRDKYTIRDVFDVNSYIGKKLAKRYTMEDIGRLDRRLEKAEASIAINAITVGSSNNINNPVVGAPTANTINGVKTGLFTDNFNDYNQSEINNFEMTAIINQSEGKLVPKTKNLNLYCNFNYANTLTVNSLFYEGNVSEPGVNKWGESVLMLPTNGTEIVVNQKKFTSAITASGDNVRFIGTMIPQPEVMKVGFRVEIKQTDTYEILKDPTFDVTPNNTPITNTDPVYTLSASAFEVHEGSNVVFLFTTKNIANGTTFGYTISGSNVNANDVGSLTGTFTVNGSNTAAYGNVVITANSDATSEGSETMVFTVNTVPTTSVNVIIRDTSLTPEYELIADRYTITEGSNTFFTFTATNSITNTYSYTFSGYRKDWLTVPVSGTFTTNATGKAIINVGTQIVPGVQSDVESQSLFLEISHPANIRQKLLVQDYINTKFVLTSNISTVSEGDAFKVSVFPSRTISNGYVLPYVITGVSTTDINVPLTGNLTFSSDQANLVITANADFVTDGIKTLKFTINPVSNNVTIDSNPSSVDILILDTSKQLPTLTANVGQITEGESVLFTLGYAGFSGNVAYTISGVGNTDINVPLTGNLTVASNSATLSVTSNVNPLIQGTRTLSLSVNTLPNNVTSSVLLFDGTLTRPTLVASNNSIFESNSVTFTLTVPGVTGNVAYAVTGTNIDANDFSSGSLTGNVVLTSGVGTVSFTANTNGKAGPSYVETMVLTCNTVPYSGQTISRSVELKDPILIAPITLVANQTNIANNESVTFTIQANAYNGKTFGYTIAGVTTVDISGTSLTGNFSTITNNVGTLTITSNSTSIIDKTLTLIANTGTNQGNVGPVSVGIKTTVQPITLTSNKNSIANNESVTFTIQANSYNGSTFQYTITGVTTNDISGTSLTGNFSTITNNVGTLTITSNSTLASDKILTLMANTAQGNVGPSVVQIVIVEDINYVLSTNKNSVSRGNSVIVTLNTSGIGNASYPYVITGANANDFVSNTLSGSLSITGNTQQASGTLTLDITDKADAIGKTFDIAFASAGNVNTDITILPVVQSFTISSNKNIVTRGSNVDIKLNSVGVGNASYNYVISNANTSDFVGGSLSGSLSLTGNTKGATGSVTLNIADIVDNAGKTFNISFASAGDSNVSIDIAPVVPSFVLNTNKSVVNELDSVTFTLTSSKASLGGYTYTITGTDVLGSDFVGTTEQAPSNTTVWSLSSSSNYVLGNNVTVNTVSNFTSMVSPASGTYAAVFGKDSTPNGLQIRTLTSSTKIDLTSTEKLSFEINKGGSGKSWGNQLPDQDHNDDMYLRFSSDGISYTPLIRIRPNDVTLAQEWKSYVLTLPAAARVSGGVFLQFYSETKGSADAGGRDIWAISGNINRNNPFQSATAGSLTGTITTSGSTTQASGSVTLNISNSALTINNTPLFVTRSGDSVTAAASGTTGTKVQAGTWGNFLKTYGVSGPDATYTVVFPYSGFYEFELSTDNDGVVYIDGVEKIRQSTSLSESKKHEVFVLAGSRSVRLTISSSAGDRGIGLTIKQFNQKQFKMDVAATNGANASVAITPATKTYQMFSDKTSVNEGEAVTFTLQASGIGNATFNYSISPASNNSGIGISSADFITPMNGQVSLSGNLLFSTGTLSVLTANTPDIEQPEVFTFNVSGFPAPQSPIPVILINRQIGTPTISVNRPIVIIEGDGNIAKPYLSTYSPPEIPLNTAVFTLNMTGIPDGTTIPYSIRWFPVGFEAIPSNVLDLIKADPYRYKQVYTGNGSLHKYRIPSNLISGNFTVNNGQAQLTVPCHRDEYTHVTSFYVAADPRALGFAPIASPIVSMESAWAASQYSLNLTRNVLSKGQSTELKISNIFSYDGTIFNYSITGNGITSADFNGLPLTGTITAKQTEFVDDGDGNLVRQSLIAPVRGSLEGSLIIPSNSSITTSKNFDITVTPGPGYYFQKTSDKVSGTIMAGDIFNVSSVSSAAAYVSEQVGVYANYSDDEGNPVYNYTRLNLVDVFVGTNASVPPGTGYGIRLINESRNNVVLFDSSTINRLAFVQPTVTLPATSEHIQSINDISVNKAFLRLSVYGGEWIYLTPELINYYNFFNPVYTTQLRGTKKSGTVAPSYGSQLAIGNILRIEILSEGNIVSTCKTIVADMDDSDQTLPGLINRTVNIGY